MPLFHACSTAKYSPPDRHHTPQRISGAGCGLAFVAILILLFKASLAAAATIGSGYSAQWYDPARSGEGLQLEILDANSALMEWYTYDEHGAQRWLQGVGQIIRDPAGDSIKFAQLYDTHGGKFGPNFNPADVQLKIVGDATLSFGDCNTGTFTYHAYGQSQTLPMQRLTQTMGAGCEPINGIPGQPVMSYAGQSGSWFDTTHSGEGFALQWLATGQALATWYTYDTQGNQVWLLGVGAEQNGAIVFDQMAITSGAHFGTAFDPASVQKEDWGTLTLQIDCHGGTAHYASKQAAFGTGDLNLTRLTTLAQPACPTVKPKLSDLYNITWDEIPIEAGTAANPNVLQAQAIADDGTVAGQRNGHLVLWHPDTRIWEDVLRELASQPVNISPDGSAVIATNAINADPSQPIQTLMWQRSTNWQALPGATISQSYHDGVSHNFEYIVGTGRDADGSERAWVRTIDGSQMLLPKSDALPPGTPSAVSNNGNAIVGYSILAISLPPTTVAIRWDNAGAPTLLRNPNGEELASASACNADCSIVFGDGIYHQSGTDNPNQGEAWYLTSDGAFGFLGVLPDATAPRYNVSDTASDGSLAVGGYITYPSVHSPDGVFRSFIWTQATGIVSVRSLVDDLSIGDDDWYNVAVTRVSPDGRKILLAGVRDQGLEYYRAVVLQLTPKSASN